MADNYRLLQPSFPHPTGMAWLKNHTALDATGKPLALIGTAFLEAVGLHTPEVLDQFGINQIWFGRYFAAGVTPPAVFAEDTLHTRTNSLMGLKIILTEGYTPPPTWETDLKTHLLTALQTKYPEANLPEEKHIKIQVTNLCCEKACYGCLDSTMAKTGDTFTTTNRPISPLPAKIIQPRSGQATTTVLNLIA